VQLARMLTSIDLISGGRLIPGFGIGWSPEEYEAAGYDFSTRGARMNELLDALVALWTQDPVEFHGKLIDLPLQHSPLKPAQRPHPPIYLGGTAEAALRRVGARADGWLPLCMIPYFVDIDMMTAQRRAIDQFARDAGRNPASIDTIMRVNIMQGVSAQQTADVIKSIAEATDIEHFLIDSSFVAFTADEALDLVNEVLPLIQGG
jgi:alkanesulfonate monooxygenase SsuD/methylene tetrahydromethanopterin reductase-like flavin-dependent oxidoreductase (luciferase family)